MPPSPLPRIISWTLLCSLPGIAGFFAGQWAHEGLLTTPGRQARLAPGPPAVREPKVNPDSPEGKWMTRAKSATTGDFAALLDELDTTFPKTTAYQTHEAAQQWLLGLWITRDADAAAEYVMGKKDDILGSTFGRVLGRVAPGKAWEIVHGPLGKSLGKYFPSAVLWSLSEADPLEYFRLAGKPESKNLPLRAGRALGALADKDPEAAAAMWSERWQDRRGAKESLFTILGVWAQRNPEAARQWADNLADPEHRRIAQHACLGALARQDWQTARKTLAAMDAGEWIPGKASRMNANGSGPCDARLEIAAATAKADLPLALRDLAALTMPGKVAPPAKEDGDSDEPSKDPRLAIRRAIVEAAAPSLPDEPAALVAALHDLKSKTGKELGDELFGELQSDFLLKKLGKREGTTALEGLRVLAALPEAGSIASVLNSLVRGALRGDPAGTLDFLAHLPEAQRGDLAVAAFKGVGGDHPAQIGQAAALIPPEKWTSEMGTRLAGSALESGAVILRELPVNAATDLARKSFAESWTTEDPEAAAHWVTTLSQDAGTAQAARGVAEAWTRFDDSSASNWVAALPGGHARDGAALGLATTVAATDPESAWKWAAAISTTSLSADAYLAVAKQWGSDAPAEFRAAFSSALDGAGYAAEAKTKALSDLDQPPLPPTLPRR